MRKNFLTIVPLVCLGMLILAFRPDQQPGPWKAPDNYVKMTNPVKATAANLATGKSLYSKFCVECHGKKGEGNGPKSVELKTSPADMCKPAFQSQSDGSLFYKISEGRNEMPKFKKDITDPNDIWTLVNYIRSLKG